jgi:hypothetical protein
MIASVSLHGVKQRAPSVKEVERSAMPTTIAFCRTCNRDVHLASDDPHSCPVCSSPLVATPSKATVLTIDPQPAGTIGPEIYLG